MGTRAIAATVAASSEGEPAVKNSQNSSQSAFGLEADLAFIRSRVTSASLAPGPGPIILVATGTFNPPHRAHLMMLHAARNVLSEQVAGAVLVPSSDMYVRRKVRSSGLDASMVLSFELRTRLLLACAADLGLDGFVHVSDAEQSRDEFYLEVCQMLALALAADQPLPRLVFVTGSDRPYPLYRRSPGVSGVVVVPRAGDALPQRSSLPDELRNDPLRLVAVEIDGAADFSSTRLREAFLSTRTGSGCAAESAEATLREFMTPSAAQLFIDYFPV